MKRTNDSHGYGRAPLDPYCRCSRVDNSDYHTGDFDRFSKKQPHSVNAAQARQLANACAEEALRVLRETQTYLGTASITLSTGSCSYTVANNGGQSRLITTSSTINSVAKKMTVYATIGTSSISVTSWRES